MPLRNHSYSGRNMGIILFTIFTLFLMPPIVAAHPLLPGVPLGFSSGFMHPLVGLDHILAMLAVGVWAGRMGGRFLWRLPLGFVAASGAGFWLAMVSVSNPLMIQSGIDASLICFGSLIAMNVRVRLGRSVMLVFLFGLFHGVTHGIELPVVVPAKLFVVGFLMATALLHVVGILTGRFVRNSTVIRVGGVGIATVGILFMLMILQT